MKKIFTLAVLLAAFTVFAGCGEDKVEDTAPDPAKTKMKAGEKPQAMIPTKGVTD